MTAFLLTAAVSYLLGSIPFGYILFRIFRGQDIRQSGSGNIGATNVARSSPVLGLLTLALDAAKGYLAVYLALLLWERRTVVLNLWQVQLIGSIAALFAITGHLFPVWLKFRGGKGVATGLGAFLWVAPKTILLIVVIFAVVVLAFRYVSFGSVLAVALFPLLAWFLDLDHRIPIVLVVIGTASVLIIAKHHRNIRRLLAGTEPRFQWRRG